MDAEAAGKQAVSKGDMEDIAGPCTCGAQRARHHGGPHVEIVLVVADHGGGAGSGPRRVDANHSFAPHGKDAEWIVLTQIVFGGERKAGEIVERFEIAWCDAGLVEPTL